MCFLKKLNSSANSIISLKTRILLKNQKAWLKIKRYSPIVYIFLASILLTSCPLITNLFGNSVTYNSNSATSGTVPIDSNKYMSGDTVTILGNTGNLSKTDCVFGGWNTFADGSGDTYPAGSTYTMQNSEVTLYARWVSTHTVTYYGNGNTGGLPPSDPGKYLPDSTVTVLENTGNLSRTNFRFKTWNTKPDGSGTRRDLASTFLMPNNNVDLYAIWEPTYSVTYFGNGNTDGSVPVDPSNYILGETVTVLGNTGSLVKTAAVFSGWNTAANGSGTSRPVGSTFAMTANNISLFAQWGGHTVSPAPAVTGTTSGETDEPLSFTAIDSACNIAGHALEYLFDWGDGQQSPGWGSATASHSWSDTGTYQVRAKARCSVDPTIVTALGIALSVTINPPEITTTPTTPTITGSAPLHAGEAYSFTTGGSTCNYTYPVSLYRFDWGDGSSYSSWGSSTQSHTYPAGGGTYNVKAQAKCSNGVTSSWSSSRSVTFIAHTISRPGTPTWDGGLAYDGFGKQFYTSGSIDSWGHQVSYQFHWGNGHDSDWRTALYSLGNGQDWTPAWGVNQIFYVTVTARCTSNTSIQSTSLSSSGIKVEDHYEIDSTNDSIGTAISFGNENTWLSTAGGSMGISWNEDWYRIVDSWNGNAITVDCRFQHSKGNIDIFLYDQNGHCVGSSTGYSDTEHISYPHINLINRYLYIQVVTRGTYKGNPYDLKWDN